MLMAIAPCGQASARFSTNHNNKHYTADAAFHLVQDKKKTQRRKRQRSGRQARRHRDQTRREQRRRNPSSRRESDAPKFDPFANEGGGGGGY